jgi:hypothetical protein
MTAGRIKLLLLLALFALPGLAAWLVHACWTPTRLSNYGELLPPAPLTLPALTDAAGRAMPWSALRGRWVLLVAAPGVCDAACVRDAYLARQAHLAQGRERGRIERVMLGTGPDMQWPRAADAWRALPNPWPDALARGGLFLVDPLGNLMLRFPDAPDGRRIIGDLRRLLTASVQG